MSFRPFVDASQAAVRISSFGMQAVGPDIGGIYADQLGAKSLFVGSPDSENFSKSIVYQSYGPINPLLIPETRSRSARIPRHKILEDAAKQILEKRQASNHTAGPRYENPYAAARFGPQFGNPQSGHVLPETALDLLSVTFDVAGVVIGAAVFFGAAATTAPIVLVGAAAVGSLILAVDDGTLLVYDLTDNDAGRSTFDDSSLHHVTEAAGVLLMLGDLVFNSPKFVEESRDLAKTAIPRAAKLADELAVKTEEAGATSIDYAQKLEEMQARYGDDPIKVRRALTMRELSARQQLFAKQQIEFNEKLGQALEKLETMKREFRVKLARDGSTYVGELFSGAIVTKNIYDYYDKSNVCRLHTKDLRNELNKNHAVVHSAITFPVGAPLT
jgi:hypothetical protein